ncbi:MAG TPA: formate dehydrogenase accessory sulfurtransferase FdhD [Puia sp.]|nr:formate dehydrogenase accessory sulfurtransferase FdhD [Puia sp.]
MTDASHISSGIICLPVQKISPDSRLEAQDPVVIEEPLEIILEYGALDARTTTPVSITMRTPGHDTELALGFLYTEDILSEKADALEDANTIHISLTSIPNLKKLQRHFYTTSSCGVCGKTSIEALYPAHATTRQTGPTINAAVLYTLPSLLRQGQDLFELSGGLHAAGLFDHQGRLILVREDIGRHNALDKLIGHALIHDLLPLNRHILLLSGRACFELIQKAAMAGISIIAAVGPPSSLAVQLAEESGITLVGFLKHDRFNIYSGAHRIRL